MSDYSKQIDEILDMAGFQIFPYEANEQRLKAKAAITALLAQAEVAVYDRIINHFEGLEGYMPVRHSPKESVLIELQQLKANQKEQEA